jgi:hypothetical protein
MNLYEVSLTKLSKQIVVKDGSIQKLLSDLSCTNVETIRRTIFQVGSCEVAEDQNFMRISENEISSARSQSKWRMADGGWRMADGGWECHLALGELIVALKFSMKKKLNLLNVLFWLIVELVNNGFSFLFSVFFFFA